MSRDTSPKGKIVRKFSENIFGNKKFDRLLAKKPHPPGIHGKKHHRRLSDYGLQLKEKQKLRSAYSVSERQFRRYFKDARKEKAATGEKLLQILESRLDNLIFRSGFASTRAAARQLVNHGHVLVDDHKVTIPSYLVKPGQVISLGKKAQKIPQVIEQLQNKDLVVPSFLKRKAVAAKFIKLPERNQIDINIQEQLIVEFYSR